MQSTAVGTQIKPNMRAKGLAKQMKVKTKPTACYLLDLLGEWSKSEN